MKLTTLNMFIALSMTACSGEDIQVSFEKAETPAEQLTDKLERNRQDSKAIVETPAEKSEPSSAPVAVISKEPSLKKSDVVGQRKTSPELDQDSLSNFEMVRQVEASLATVDDAGLLSAYKNNSSAIALKRERYALAGEKIALAVNKQRNLVSKVTSVSGATSITGDPTGFGFTVDLSGDFLFEFDKDTLTPKAQHALESVLTLYKDYQGTSITVNGHTDSKGAKEYNLDLSKRRATSVKKWFNVSGIESALISIQGYGETKPVAKNKVGGKDNPEGRALNRRVEIVVKTKKKVNHLPTVSTPTSI